MIDEKQAKEWLTFLFPNWTIIGVFVIIFFAFLITITAFIFIEYTSHKKPKTWKYLFIPKIILYLIIITIGYTGLSGITAIQTAKKHGCENPYIYNCKQLWDCIEYSPVEDKAPMNKKGILLLFYRFGCSDCEKIFTELQTKTQYTNNIYWISTRSSYGKTLKTKYSITEVPTGVYIQKSGKFIKLSLFQKHQTNNSHLNTNNLDTLLKSMENEI